VIAVVCCEFRYGVQGRCNVGSGMAKITENVCNKCASCMFPGCPKADDASVGAESPTMELSDGAIVCGYYIPRKDEESRKCVRINNVR